MPCAPQGSLPPGNLGVSRILRRKKIRDLMSGDLIRDLIREKKFRDPVFEPVFVALDQLSNDFQNFVDRRVFQPLLLLSYFYNTIVIPVDEVPEPFFLLSIALSLSLSLSLYLSLTQSPLSLSLSLSP